MNKLPNEVHIHIDVIGQKDANGVFRRGIPKELKELFRDVMHDDSFNPDFRAMGRNGDPSLSYDFHETPFLLTCGATFEGVIGDDLLRKVEATREEIEEHMRSYMAVHPSFIGYLEIEYIKDKFPLPDKPFNARSVSQFFPNSSDSSDSLTVKAASDGKLRRQPFRLETTTMSGNLFKTTEIHFRLENPHPFILEQLLCMGFICAKMPPNPGNENVYYFTLQTRSPRVRDQAAAALYRLADAVGGFGNSRIQLETIQHHVFYGTVDPSKHLAPTTTAIHVADEKWLEVDGKIGPHVLDNFDDWRIGERLGNIRGKPGSTIINAQRAANRGLSMDWRDL